MADAPTPPDVPTPPGTAPVPPPADASDPSKTLLTQEPPTAPDPAKVDDKPTEPAKPVIPDKYDFAALKLPEGIALNEDIVKAVEPLFKKYGLTQEAASELVQAHGEALAKVEAANETKREADFKDWMKTQAEQNVAAIRKEWGHEFDVNLKVAQRGLARVFGPEGKALLDETGMGSHPEFLKAFLAVGKMIQEDTPPVGGQPNGRKTTTAVLYPNTPGAQ